MPGKKQVSEDRLVRAQFVLCKFTAEDEAKIMEGKGSWPEGYTPTSILTIHYMSDDQSLNAPPITATGETAALAIKEFFMTLPESHKLVKKILDGSIQDGKDVSGGKRAREILDGVEMDFHDGKSMNKFTITKDEVKENVKE